MSEIASSVQVGMKDLQKLLLAFGPEVSICIRGRHAVGKSEGTYQAAAMMRHDFYKNPENCARYGWSYDKGLPVIERRLSQLTEGDLTGMPDLSSDRKATAFKPCDWYIDACERPVVLFLDERNRALEGVKQAIFQIMDSRAFYGHSLHPGTRVIVAENIGDVYNVQQCDPAEVSRAATVELSPTVDEWIGYASGTGGCHEMTTSFIRTHPEHLEFTTSGGKMFESNKKYPDRRSWYKLDHQLQVLGLFDEPSDPMFYKMTASMVGIEAALRFADFANHFERQISVKEILTDWATARKKLGKFATSAKYIELAKKLQDYFANNSLTTDEARQVTMFMTDAPAEPRMFTWGALVSEANQIMVHQFAKELLYKTVQEDMGPDGEFMNSTSDEKTDEKEKPAASVKKVSTKKGK